MAGHYLAMQCYGSGQPLRDVHHAMPVPGPKEMLIEVAACGAYRTDLHVIEGDIPRHYPIVPGHEIVDHIRQLGSKVEGFKLGERIGVPWLGHICGECQYYLSGKEDLCDVPEFTSCTRDGGYAEFVMADSRYCFQLSYRFSDAKAESLLYAELIGWRAFRLAGEGDRIGSTVLVWQRHSMRKEKVDAWFVLEFT